MFRIDLAEFGDGLFGESVGDVVLVRIALEILKREHRQNGRGVDRFDIGNETITLALNGLNETRILGGVPQGAANLANHRVDAGVDINENIRSPKVIDNLFAEDKLSAAIHQRN